MAWLGFLAFLASGLYLRRGRPELYEGSEVVRALFRANHLYLQAAALLNMLAARVGGTPSRLRTRLRTAGSFLLIATVPLLTYAFFSDPLHGLGGRTLTTVSMVLMLLGTLLLTLTTPKAQGP